MECKKCGTTNQDNAKFCCGCGADLSLQNAGEGLDMDAQQSVVYNVPPQNQNYEQSQNFNPNFNQNFNQNYTQNYNYNQNQGYDPNYTQNQNYNYNQNPGQNPNYGYNPYQNNMQDPGKGLAIAALVLGIVSFFCFPIITGVLGIVFGGVAKSKGCRSGMATAGIVCGAIGLGLWFVMLIAGFSFMPFF